MTHSVADAIMQRRSIRNFKGHPLTDEQVQDLLRAAQLAPSSLNTQPWRFKVLRNPDDLRWLAGGPSRQQGWLAKAGAVFVCCVDVDAYVSESEAAVLQYQAAGMSGPMVQGIRDYVEREKAAPRRERELSAALNAALAVESMMLHAVEVGLGSCWVGMFDRQAVAGQFGIPEHLHIVCLLALGAPQGEPGPQTRKPLKDIVIP